MICPDDTNENDERTSTKLFFDDEKNSWEKKKKSKTKSTFSMPESHPFCHLMHNSNKHKDRFESVQLNPLVECSRTNVQKNGMVINDITLLVISSMQ